MKPFSPTLYQANDNAKYLVIDYLIGRGWTAEVNPDDYGIDILARKGEKEMMVEVEVKHNWVGGEFPFSTVQLPERKTKFAQLPHCWFFIVSSDRGHALAFSGESALSSPLVTVPNKLVSEGERFYQIPLANCYTISFPKGNG